MKRAKGDLAVPVSKFVFKHGEGSKCTRYRVSIAAIKKEGGFEVVLRVERLSASEFFRLLLGHMIIYTIVGFTHPMVLPVVIPPFVLISAIGLANNWKNVNSAIEAFALPYA